MSRYTKAFPVYATSSGNLAATASSGGGAHATVTLAAPGSTTMRTFLTDIIWSYSTTPTTGGLSVYNGTSSGALIFNSHVTAVGPTALELGPIGGTPGNAITVQLLQAGSSIVGWLNVYGYKE